MTNFESYLEKIWDQLLSREPLEITRAFLSLDAVSQKNVLEHLKLMTTEPGWHPEQVKSASVALAAIESIQKI